MKQLHLLLLAAVLLTSGCTHNIGDFTILSSKCVDLSVIGSARRGQTKAHGEDIQHIIVIIPTAIPNLKQALDNAIECTPGAVALVDARLYFRHFYIPYIYGQNAYIVEGTSLMNPAQANRFPTKHIVVSYDATQKRYVAQPVSAAYYAALKRKYYLDAKTDTSFPS